MDTETSGHDPHSPTHLVARIREGDVGAEGEMVERFGRAIMLILDRQTGGRPEAEDLYQDTFRLALEKLRRGELREPAKLPGFLSQIARNLAIDHYRKIVRRQTDADSEAVQEGAVVASCQLDRVLRHEYATLVRRVIAELRNERDRQILFRFYIADEDRDQILADLELSDQQFNKVLHRARQRYKELFQQHLAASTGGTGTLAGLLWGAIFVCLVTLERMEDLLGYHP